jgi:hypothetical protein
MNEVTSAVEKRDFSSDDVITEFPGVLPLNVSILDIEFLVISRHSDCMAVPGDLSSCFMVISVDSAKRGGW